MVGWTDDLTAGALAEGHFAVLGVRPFAAHEPDLPQPPLPPFGSHDRLPAVRFAGSVTPTSEQGERMDINGVAHVVFRVHRFEECVSFYDRLMPGLGLQCVHREEDFVYFVGGRTALAIRTVRPECSAQRHVDGGAGLDHLCWRVRSRDDVDAVFALLMSMGAEIVRSPQEGPWAPGYYSLSFLDPEGIRLEVNHVPGEGVLAADVSFTWDPEHPLRGRSDAAS